VKKVQDYMVEALQRRQIDSLFGGYMEVEAYLEKVSSLIGVYIMEVGALGIIKAVLCTLLGLCPIVN